MFVEHVETPSVKIGDKLAPTPANLAYLLRHKELWPEGFQWYFPDWNSCAMGLASRYWDQQGYFSTIGPLETKDWDMFHRGGGNFRIFGITIGYPKPMPWVTPLDIARRIEAVL